MKRGKKMKNYEVRVVPKKDDHGKTYWTAFFPALDGCIGGGDTAEEAIKEAEENLEVFLDYLKSEGENIPSEYEENSFSGRIALRTSKTTHRKLAQISDEEGISINMLINNAIECYIGKIEYSQDFDKKIEEIQKTSSQSLVLQKESIIANAVAQENINDHLVSIHSIINAFNVISHF